MATLDRVGKGAWRRVERDRGHAPGLSGGTCTLHVDDHILTVWIGVDDGTELATLKEIIAITENGSAAAST